MTYKTVLTIAGSDSGGGAGIQADIKTISACGCYAASAITAVTIQNTLGVEAVHPVPVNTIRGQIRAVLTDIGALAIKIGMLHSSEVIRTVAEELRNYGKSLLADTNAPHVKLSSEKENQELSNNLKHYNDRWSGVVLDPVMVSTSGHRLMEKDALETLITDLLPWARVITPNIPEAEILLGGVTLNSKTDLPDAARELACRNGVSVFLKAGHLIEDRLVDIFYDHETGKLLEFPSVRIHTRNTHGTGCTMSSALASYLALGLPLLDAARAAKEYINQAIISGAQYEIGHGYGPVNHFWKK